MKKSYDVKVILKEEINFKIQANNKKEAKEMVENNCLYAEHSDIDNLKLEEIEVNESK
jgi:hypothetical protein